MKDYGDLISRFDDIQDLPVSEEMLGAYLEGNLLDVESRDIELYLGQSPLLNSIVADISENDSEHISFNSEDITLPQLDYMGNFIIEDISIPNTSSICEAQKHYGLEPLNIDFDPDTYQWEQDTCAIRSQEIVLRSFGQFTSQEDLIQLAQAHGWYNEGSGTPMDAVGNLLDLYNVPNHRMTNANIFNLVDELGQGHKVIVGVDIDEIYGNSFWQSIKEHLVGKTPNHAMIVSGLDTYDPDCTKVILTDPGTGKTLFEVPYDKFLSAWNDSDCFMVATDDPAPLQYNPNTMINFDYSKGHVASLGSIPFDELHNEIVPNVNNYLDSIDEYIAVLERTMANGFNLDDFNDMIDKADTAHQKAIDLQLHNVEQRRFHQDFLARSDESLHDDHHNQSSNCDMDSPYNNDDGDDDLDDGVDVNDDNF